MCVGKSFAIVLVAVAFSSTDLFVHCRAPPRVIIDGYPEGNIHGLDYDKFDFDEPAVASFDVEGPSRYVRSLQPHSPNFPIPGQPQATGWEVNPNVNRNDAGNTRATIGVKHTGPNHEVGGTWSKVVDGPGKSKPTWNVGGTYRWRRSPDWEVTPNVVHRDGDTQGSVNVKHTGEDYDVHGGWQGNGHGGDSWNVGGTIRWRRSLQPGAPNFPIPGQSQTTGWEVNPNVNRNDAGNTRATLGVKHTGPNHEVGGTWSKIVNGPGKSKPTWNVGGKYRWRRSPDWEVTPNVVHKDGDTQGSVNVKHTGEDYDVHGGWQGGGHGGDSWNVGGTIRWRRSLQPGAPNFPVPGQNQHIGWEVNPNVNRNDAGNTRATLGVKHTGPNHEVGGTWSKVVDGPGKSKPTWNVGGKYRWRRSPDWEVTPNVAHRDGKTQGSVDVKHTGENYDVHGGWQGRGNSRDSWNVGGTIRWRRSPDWEVTPNVVHKDGDTQGSVNVKHTGEGYDVHGGWQGDGHGGDSWHVGGTIKFD